MTNDHTSFFRHIALENAAKYEGKTNPKALIGKVLSVHPEYKSDMPKLMKLLAEVVEQVNSMSIDEQKTELEHLGVTHQKKVHNPYELKELEGAKPGNVVMRLAPSASGPGMHIGHALTGAMTCAYIKKYGGKFILRLEDTDSNKVDLMAYQKMPEDANWVFGNVHEIVVQSDRMDLYYKYARSFAEKGDIYVCSCSQETFKKIADSQQDCPCRKLTPAQSIIRFESMFEKSKSAEGDFVLRWKANMKDPNPAMRDFPLMRINDTPHPRTKDKYRVWPLMNMSVFVDDVEMGMTHIIRGKDHMDNAKRQNMMYKALGKVAPVTLFVGMYDIVGLELSKSKTKELIEQGVYSGWEDIRIPYLRPMRRRGYQAQAFVNYGIEVGISQVDKTISAEDFFGKLNSLNKEIIDPIANRYSLIQDPVELKIRNVGEQSIMLDLHPKARGSGGRPFKVNGSVLIEKIDFDLTSEGSYIRLMDYCNIRRIGDSWEYVSESYEDYKSLPADNKIIIHWLPADQTQLTTVHVLLADGSQLLASAEKNIERTVVGDIVQFERFGFCRLDSINETTGVRQFWYAHR